MKEDILQRWSGAEEDYERHRPEVPRDLILALRRLSGRERPGLVVDLGCGTGKSSRAWADLADEVVGVEPSARMLDVARRRTNFGNIRYIGRYGHETGLEDQCADIVVAASSFHWMTPEPTLREIVRLLKADGLFAFFGPSHPPVTPFMEVDRGYEEFVAAVTPYAQALPPADRWDWTDLLGRIDRSGAFPLHRRFHIHQETTWDAAGYLGWLQTTNELHTLAGLRPPGFESLQARFRETVERFFAGKRQVCLFVYTIYAFRQ